MRHRKRFIRKKITCKPLVLINSYTIQLYIISSCMYGKKCNFYPPETDGYVISLTHKYEYVSISPNTHSYKHYTKQTANQCYFSYDRGNLLCNHRARMCVSIIGNMVKAATTLHVPRKRPNRAKIRNRNAKYEQCEFCGVEKSTR